MRMSTQTQQKTYMPDVRGDCIPGLGEGRRGREGKGGVVCVCYHGVYGPGVIVFALSLLRLVFVRCSRSVPKKIKDYRTQIS